MKTIKILFAFAISFLFLNINISIAQEDGGENTSVITEIEGLTARMILDNYIDAIGGADLFSGIEDRTTIMRGTAMGQSLTVVLKQKAPNKLRQEIKVAGMDQIMIFDGEKGVMNVSDQKIEIKGKELERLKIEGAIKFLLSPEDFDVIPAIEGLEKIDDKEVYVLKMTMPSGLRWMQYFDKETGLKIKETKEMQTQMGLFEQTTIYEDYREVEGMKYPFTLKQSVSGQNVEMTVSSVKVNSGLSDDLFVIED